MLRFLRWTKQCTARRKSTGNPSLGVQSLEPRLALAATPQLVENINFGAAGSSPRAESFTTVGATTFFVAEHPSAGYELWKTDGTTEGTVLVKDIWPGADSSFLPGNWIAAPAAGRVYFAAGLMEGGKMSRNIWSSDGTEAGTTKVTNFPNPLRVSTLALVDAKLFITDSTPGLIGANLYTIDTATQQVQLVKQFPGGVTSQAVAFGNKLFFVADDGQGVELYASDGTLNGTSLVRDINTAVNGNSFPRDFTVVGDRLLFTAENGDSGRELWVTDGSRNGTTRVDDINPLAASSNPRDLAALGGKLYFSADNPQKRDLYVYDPATPTVRPLRIDVNPGTAVASDPAEFTLFNGAVYFVATSAPGGRELFRLSGTTPTLIDIAPGQASSSPTGLRVAGQSLVFAAENASGDRELYRIAGTGTASVLANIWDGGSSLPATLATVGGTVYFSADDGRRGRELWKTDGTSAGTSLVRDCNDADPKFPYKFNSYPMNFVEFDGRLFFRASSFTGRFDGRGNPLANVGLYSVGANGRHALGQEKPRAWTITPPRERPENASEIQVTWLVPVGNTLYFTLRYTNPLAGPLDDSSFPGGWLYKLDAGSSAAVEVKRFPTFEPQWLEAFKGRLFFSASDDGFNRRLWVSGGTGDSTVPFGDAFEPSWFTAFTPSVSSPQGSFMFFSAREPGTGNYEVWRTDGTDNGVTGRFADLNSDGSSDPFWFTPYQGKLYFTAVGKDGKGDYGRELYWTDGFRTPELTRDIDDRPGSGSEPFGATGFNGYLYFSAENSDFGRELWRTNGTVTERMTDLNPGKNDSWPLDLTVVGNRLLFAATDGRWTELWSTADGTNVTRVTSINPNGAANPRVMVDTVASKRNLFLQPNGRLYFRANDGTRGHELWELDQAANATRLVADINPGSDGSFSGVGSAVFDGKLYFYADDGVAGNELWCLPLSPVTAGRGERDFNGDGVADVLWRDAATGAHAVHLLDRNGAVTAGRGLGGDLGLTIAATGDLNGDGVADIVWRNAAGSHTLHLMRSDGIRSADRSLGLTGFTLEATGDYNGDGKTDIVWRNSTTGVHSIWLMDGVATLSAANLAGVPSNLRLATTSGNYDANGDGKTDLVWRSIADGSTALWRMNGTGPSSVASLPRAVGFALIGTGDFDGDGRGDLLWRNDRNGGTSMWLMNDTAVKSTHILGGDKGLSVVATGDYNGDGKTDLVWRSAATGVNTQWLMNGATRTSDRNLGGDARRLSIVRIPGLPVVSSGPLRARESDFNGDGISDVVWRDSATGAHAVHMLDSRGEIAEGRGIGGDPNLSIVVTGDFNGDGVSDRIWRTGSAATGTHTIHLLRANGSILQDRSLGLAGFTVAASGDYNGDGRTDLMWRSSTGGHSIWLMNGTAPSATAIVVVPAGWQVFGLSGNYDANGDGKDDVLLRRSSDGTTVLWRMNGTQVSAVSQLTGAMAFTLAGVGDFDGDGRGDLIWRNNSTGRTSMWLMNDSQVKSTHVLGGDLTLQMVVTGDYNGDGRTDLVWRNTTTGATTLHLMDGPTTLTSRPLAGSKTLLPLSAAGKR